MKCLLTTSIWCTHWQQDVHVLYMYCIWYSSQWLHLASFSGPRLGTRLGCIHGNTEVHTYLLIEWSRSGARMSSTALTRLAGLLMSTVRGRGLDTSRCWPCSGPSAPSLASSWVPSSSGVPWDFSLPSYPLAGWPLQYNYMYRPIALMSHYSWHFRILSGSRHLGVPIHIGFICGIDRNVPYIDQSHFIQFNTY